MKFYLAALCILFSLSEVFSTSITVSGSVSGTWTADSVLVEGNLLIPGGELLVISPGTVVQFQSYYRIDVQGRLLAEGAPGDSILFTIRDTSNFYAQSQGRGGWSGIRFRNLASDEDSSVFSFCRFEFSKATEDSINSFGGAILSHEFNKLSVRNCLFFHNYSFYSGGAVYLNESDARVENCTFSNNYSGNTGTVYGYGGGVCSMKSSPVIVNNKFYNNSSTGVGGGASFDNSDPVFEFNVMQYNYSGLGGALGVLRSSPAATLNNNLITNNTALFFGGGICCIRSFPVFSNLTIANNSAAYAGGFYCNDSASPSLYNSVIWGNTGLGISVYIWDIYSAPNFYYCDIEGDTTAFEGSGSHQGYHGQYMNNLNENPQFNGNGTYPFQLLAGSSCIDAGTPDAGFLNLPPTDLTGSARITNYRIDLGTYEYNGTTTVKPDLKANNALLIYPNPIIHSATILLPEPSVEVSEISISDSQGKLIRKLNCNTNEISILWDGKDKNGNLIPSGVYFLKANTADKIYSCKLIK